MIIYFIAYQICMYVYLFTIGKLLFFKLLLTKTNGGVLLA